ncbi:GGDEF domain-containing protein [Devosia sp. XK-2]|uniref:GGDEF domain-containing protein n=1 Tax=Devosia sp. XK-2 TaxID=3126689 RepID=UPI0030D4A7C3
MDTQTNTIWTLPEIDPVKALAPIRRLVWLACLCALVAGGVLVLSALHIMETTDELSLARERARVAQIADIVVSLQASEADAELARLGAMAGLRDLALSSRPLSGEGRQSMPLLSGPLGGQFLTWTADRPGVLLFQRHAPLRVPLMLVLIGSVLGCLVAMLRHVRRIEQQRAAAQRQALRDHLTGLPNRLALDKVMTQLAAEQRHFSVLALDLDRFKPINDLFGHHAGDQALVEMAARLSAQLRAGEFLARVGGDEFVAIVHRGQQHADLAAFAEDCIAASAAPLASVGFNVTVGMSLGIVVDGLEHPAPTLLKQADRALYEAKRRQGSTFCFAGGSRPAEQSGDKPEGWAPALPPAPVAWVETA